VKKTFLWIMAAAVTATCVLFFAAVVFAQPASESIGELLVGKAAFGDWRTDASLVRREIIDLPPPYATRSVSNPPPGDRETRRRNHRYVASEPGKGSVCTVRYRAVRRAERSSTPSSSSPAPRSRLANPLSRSASIRTAVREFRSDATPSQFGR
jgi:hypothetical protein